jgi:hypothetical protein
VRQGDSDGVCGDGGILVLVGFKGVKGEEEMGRHRFSGGVKAARRRFGSALCTWRRAVVGSARCDNAGHRRR